MGRRIIATGTLALIVAAAGVALWRHGPRTDAPPRQPGPAPLEILATRDNDGFARVRPSRDLHFPADHGAHGAHRAEWWYLSGTLEAGARHPIGLQLALTRVALAPDPPERASAWATSAVYFGFVTVSDPGRGRPRAHRRMARAALGLAGASSGPIRIWIEDWRLERMGSAGAAADWRLRLAAGDLQLALELRATKPPIGASELPRPDTARAPPFRVVLQPRMAATGALRVGARRATVTGIASMEHAWGELPVPGGPVARDRFTLYLDDGRELFCIRTHRVDGSGRPTTTGLLVGRDGRRVMLSSSDIELDPSAYWTSGRTGARYPVRWTLRVPAHAIQLELSAYSEDNEAVVWAPLWAGPVRLHAISGAGRRTGDGFMQLNGYDARARP